MNYEGILNKTLLEITKQKHLANQITFIRLFCALFALFAFYHLFGNNFSDTWLFLGISATAIFLFLVNFHQKLLKKIEFNGAIVQICKKELAAEKGIIEQFDGGNEYINPEHEFTLDLDIFGKNSIFQLLNRTFTLAGKDILANQLQSPFQEKKVIEQRQEAIRELELQTELRVNFLANGSLLKENIQKFKNFEDWLNEDQFAYFQKNNFLLWLIPTINIIFMVLYTTDVFSFRVWLFIFLIQTGLGFVTRRKISEVFLKIDKYLPTLQQYTDLFKLIENEKFESQLLNEWQHNLVNNKFVSSTQIEKLIIWGKYFDLRNTLFGPILNALFLWDYQCGYRLELWKQQNSVAILQSFDFLHEFEALLSVACFAYANPNNQFPKISATYPLNTQNLGHPLLKIERRVCNDFEIRGKEQLFIATGANMAGKSTFLRSVGVNLVLAMIGSPVCAEKFVFEPIQIFTCMRITDSIGEGESYFHAELVRLQRVIKLLEAGKHLFVILDELLKGTNSKDKLLGSELYLKKLLDYKTVFGLIATHDLDLTNMAKTYADSIKNICFEITIKDNQMKFDYKLREGATQNMNALFLMKQMGILSE